MNTLGREGREYEEEIGDVEERNYGKSGKENSSKKVTRNRDRKEIKSYDIIRRTKLNCEEKE